MQVPLLAFLFLYSLQFIFNFIYMKDGIRGGLKKNWGVRFESNLKKVAYFYGVTAPLSSNHCFLIKLVLSKLNWIGGQKAFRPVGRTDERLFSCSAVCECLLPWMVVTQRRRYWWPRDGKSVHNSAAHVAYYEHGFALLCWMLQQPPSKKARECMNAKGSAGHRLRKKHISNEKAL